MLNRRRKGHAAPPAADTVAGHAPAVRRTGSLSKIVSTDVQPQGSIGVQPHPPNGRLRHIDRATFSGPLQQRCEGRVVSSEGSNRNVARATPFSSTPRSKRPSAPPSNGVATASSLHRRPVDGLDVALRWNLVARPSRCGRRGLVGPSEKAFQLGAEHARGPVNRSRHGPCHRRRVLGSDVLIRC